MKALPSEKLDRILSWLRGMPWYRQLRLMEYEAYASHDLTLRSVLSRLIAAKTGTVIQKEVIIGELIASLKSTLAQH